MRTERLGRRRNLETGNKGGGEDCDGQAGGDGGKGEGWTESGVVAAGTEMELYNMEDVQMRSDVKIFDNLISDFHLNTFSPSVCKVDLKS